jgi:tetratricopeptide (TPR) repeat protein
MSNRYWKRRWLALFSTISFTLCLCLNHLPSTNFPLQIGEIVNAQNSNTSQLVQQGIDSYKSGDFPIAIDRWHQALKEYQNPINQAIIIENLARAYPQIGQTEKAISHWEQVISLYQQLKKSQQPDDKIKTEQKISRAKTELAQIYSSIGQPKKAIMLLCSPQENDINETCTKNGILQNPEIIKDTNLEIAILGTLGDAYRLTGRNEQATKHLTIGLEIAKKLNNNNYITSLNNSLGNVYSSSAALNYRRASSTLGNTDKFKQDGDNDAKQAIKFLQASQINAHNQQDKPGEIQAIVSLVRLYRNIEEIKESLESNNQSDKILNSQKAGNLLQEATNLLKYLPKNRAQVYDIINLISLQKPKTRGCVPQDFSQSAEKLLNDAIDIAQNLKDSRAESFALGEQGHIYECRDDYPKAIEITEKAEIAAEKGLKSLEDV